jgi:hypothetical protein
MSDNAGTGAWTLFVNALDEARSRGVKPSRKDRVGRPKRHLADIELKTLKQAEQLRRRLDKKLVEMGSDWIPDESFVETFKSVVSAVNQLSRTYRLGREAEAKAFATLTEEQLLDVLRVQLPRIATDFSEDEWRVLIGIGMGEDIAEAAIAVWKQRAEEVRAARAATQFKEGNQAAKRGVASESAEGPHAREPGRA